MRAYRIAEQLAIASGLCYAYEKEKQGSGTCNEEKGEAVRKQKMEKGSREKLLMLLYLGIYLTVALTIALNQPLNDTFPSLCNPPDEHSRYKVPLYICNHGTLPTGFEEELFSGECRWTYGFYTLLPYMVQGYAMRFVKLFTDSQLALLYTARLVNVAIGFGMAWLVWLLGKKLFQDERVRWLFCFLVTFLPQSLFLHTYVNPDSMCLLSTALMLYGLVCGYGDGFSVRACGFLAAGVILCALSYYNAYGFILGSMVLFAAYFLKRRDGRWKYDWRGLLKKGLPICGVVLLCISWSFIRNYILYDGDIVGLTTKENFIKSFGIARETYHSQGKPLSEMLFQTDFFEKLSDSFIACYGSTSLYTRRSIYRFYRILFGVGILSMVFCRSRNQKKTEDRKWLRVLFHGVMVFCMLMPLILLIRYAYMVDYQAQGRYILPGVIPFMYYVSRGLEKFPLWRKCPEKGKNWLCTAVLAGIVLALVITVYGSALPYYLQAQVI